jgi:hypothetical protein
LISPGDACSATQVHPSTSRRIPRSQPLTTKPLARFVQSMLLSKAAGTGKAYSQVALSV